MDIWLLLGLKSNIMKNLLCVGLLCLSLFTYAQKRDKSVAYKLQEYIIDTLSINTKESDFGVNYIGNNEVVFSSPKKDKLFSRKWKENAQGYLELYKGRIAANGGISQVEKYSRVLNSRYHEAALAITQNGKYVYFTSNNHIGKKGIKDVAGYNNLQLYKADIVDGSFENVRLLPFNGVDYSTGHPYLSKDDATLYFVSDRPGGLGQTDLYKVAVLENDTYGDVINLGERINSTGREMFPFLDTDDVLYFSSDREGTQGGLDVYGISLTNTNDTLFQLPLPINSIKDDFAFVLGTDGHGFLSSNRDGGKGDDDIYKLITNCTQKLKGWVFNTENKRVIKGARVYIYNDDVIIDSLITDKKGVFNSQLMFSCSQNYKIKVSKHDYYSDSIEFQTPLLRNFENEISLYIKPKLCSQKISGFVYNQSRQNQIVKKSSVYIYENDTLIDSVLTDEKGKFTSSINLKCSGNYRVEAHKEYFKSSIKYLDTNLENNLENRLDLYLEPYFVDRKINIKPIYFDVNKWNIRTDAAVILDEVVAVMKKFPTIIVEGGSHTDSRGKDSYNESLSAKRAKATVDYIISKGISSNRITSKGYGETKLVNKCKNGVRCTKQEHQLNRRTEFVIVKK